MTSDVHGIDFNDEESIRPSVELVFLQQTPRGAVLVFYWRASNPTESLSRAASSTAPFDVWLRGQAERLHPVPLEMLTEIAKSNSLVAAYPREL